MKDDNGNLKVSWHVAIWIATMIFMAGVFVATIEARDYTQNQVKELRLELKHDLERINSGIEKLNERLSK